MEIDADLIIFCCVKFLKNNRLMGKLIINHEFNEVGIEVNTADIINGKKGFSRIKDIETIDERTWIINGACDTFKDYADVNADSVEVLVDTNNDAANIN